MAPKTIKNVLADMLEDLSGENFQKFCHKLVDRREGPRVRRNRVEGKGFLVVADVLVSAFTEAKALEVAVEILRQIGCNEEAKKLVEESAALPSKPGSSDTAEPSTGAVPKMADSRSTDMHFVDKHSLELIQRVSNIAPILDELLHQDVISQETYSKIRAQSISQEKIRALYEGPLKGGAACKDAFYESLKKNEKFLIQELEKKN